MAAGFTAFLMHLLNLLSLLSLTIAAPLTGSSSSPSQTTTTLQRLLQSSKTTKQDDFYKPPTGFETKPPGTILQYRPVPGNLTFDNKKPVFPKAAWQLLYRTQNSVGAPIANIVTVLVPYNAKKTNLFVYDWFSLSPSPLCLPSVGMQIGGRADNEDIQAQFLVPVFALNEGWYVSIADDGGPQAGFSSGPLAAYAILDSIRAVKSSGNITGISSDPITTMYGYSASGNAVSWATELQPAYAPELKVAGAAVGGITPNVTFLMETANGKPWSMFGPPTVMGLSHEFSNLSHWLDENLLPDKAAEFRRVENQCFRSFYDMQNIDFGGYLRGGLSAFLTGVPLSVMEHAGIQGMHGTPRIPWYLFHSAGDDASPIEEVDKLYAKHCANGATIQVSYMLRIHTSVNSLDSH
ncbi:LIP-domain-containing protein [Tothia fuscella]|uniref:LIP-domain-containing protein n=1 Tax=Tothia fuscella TaxID=1048955 RepID=A0A9P4NN83_9PEZI|nr:LIP-domain-containing protein [Tothia fuscella]